MHFKDLNITNLHLSLWKDFSFFFSQFLIQFSIHLIQILKHLWWEDLQEEFTSWVQGKIIVCQQWFAFLGHHWMYITYPFQTTLNLYDYTPKGLFNYKPTKFNASLLKVYLIIRPPNSMYHTVCSCLSIYQPAYSILLLHS